MYAVPLVIHGCIFEVSETKWEFMRGAQPRLNEELRMKNEELGCAVCTSICLEEVDACGGRDMRSAGSLSLTSG